MRAKKMERALDAWQAHRDELAEMVETAGTFRGVTAADADDLTLQLKRDELVVAQVQPVGLVESRRGKGHYQGGSSGFSFRVAKGINYRIGATRGTFVQGEEQLTPIDTGTVVVTTQRAVFLGGKQTREWAWSKLLGIDHEGASNVTLLHVSNRQKASGVVTGGDAVAQLRFRLELAVALFNGTADDLAARLRHELVELDAARPGGPLLPASAIEHAPANRDVTPAPTTVASVPPPPAAPAMWAADPTARHELRYWNGTTWTAHVSDRGIATTDPL
jgi:hypothetical protein